MEHLKNNNETYFSHFLFASKVGLTLIFRGGLFVAHALVPAGNIPKQWNLENTLQKLQKWNEYTKKRLQ
tara:strand:+ start:141 stop:347 length:207 start_codon:yes stop_codon:yes gene_type:complete